MSLIFLQNKIKQNLYFSVLQEMLVTHTHTHNQKSFGTLQMIFKIISKICQQLTFQNVGFDEPKGIQIRMILYANVFCNSSLVSIHIYTKGYWVIQHMILIIMKYIRKGGTIYMKRILVTA